MVSLKIKYKIAIPIILIIIVLGATILIISHVRNLNIGENNYTNMGESILRTSEQHFAHHMYLNEIVELQKIIDNIKNNEQDVVYVFIMNSKNKVLVHTFSEGFPAELLGFNNNIEKNVEIIKYGDQKVYDFSYPIENGILGIVRLGLSGKQLSENMRRDFIYLLSLFVGFIIIGIITSFIISNKITWSINTLLKSVLKIADGNFKQRVSIKSDDEIGDLAKSVNFMAESLQSIKEELEEKIVTLENKNKEIKKINRDLLIAKETAEKSDHLKTEFLNNISHEIRTPMNAIVGFSNLLLNTKIEKQQRFRYLTIVRDRTNDLLEIINDIIYISTINSGTVEIVEEKVDLPVLMGKLFNKYETFILDKDIKFRFSLPAKNDVSNIITDYSKLNKILNSLISNAVKFTNEGEIIFGYTIKSKFVEFYVKDTGIGIDTINQKEIFDHFKKVTTKDNIYSGMGLGLSIAKAFVNILGGKLWFYSTPQKGSIFYFTIPMKSPNNLEEDMEKDKLSDFQPKNKILIVEDEITNYLFLEEILNDINVSILHAKTAKESMEIFNKNPDISLILMDIKLPDGNGYNLTKKFKSERPHVPIFAQTAYAMQTDRQKAFEAGCDDYISKPINIEKFITKLEKYITIK